MKISRLQGELFLRTIYKLNDKSFNIQTQYKILKLKKIISEEVALAKENILFKLIEEYCEKDENGNFATSEDGRTYKIYKDKVDEFAKKMDEYDKIEIQLPDIYFSEDELADLGLTLEELEIFMEFIK